jgi:hypothetical protein
MDTQKKTKLAGLVFIAVALYSIFTGHVSTGGKRHGHGLIVISAGEDPIAFGVIVGGLGIFGVILLCYGFISRKK